MNSENVSIGANDHAVTRRSADLERPTRAE